MIGLAGAAVGAVADIYNTHQQNEANKQNTWNDRIWKEKMVDQANQWNSPANKRKLMEEGGYNPFFDSSAAAPVASQPAQASDSKPAERSNLGSNMQAALFAQQNFQEMQRVNDAIIAEKESSANANNAEADAIRGYKADEADSRIDLNLSTADLNRVNSAYREVEYDLLDTFGSKQAVADINSKVASALRDLSAADVNKANIDQIVQSIAESKAREMNLKLSSDQLAQLTPLLVEGATLENLRTSATTENIQVDTAGKKWIPAEKAAGINKTKAETDKTKVSMYTDVARVGSDYINAGANVFRSMAELYPSTKMSTVVREVLDKNGKKRTLRQETTEDAEKYRPKSRYR